MAAKDYLFNILSKRAYSERDARNKLVDKGFSLADIKEAISVAKEYNFINDLRFTTNYINTYSTNRGTIRIKQELTQKGIDSFVIEDAFENVEINEHEICLNLASRAIKPNETLTQKAREKLIRGLIYKGFSYSIISEVLSELQI